jgi:hypothetical protein
MGGCDESTERAGKEKEQKAEVARTEVVRGPLRVTVEVEPHPARLSDEPTLTLTLDCEQGVQVEKPPFGEAVGDFRIRDFREPLPETRSGRDIVRQIYVLEPLRTGQLQIDPIVVTFTDNRPQGDGAKHTAETEALTIEVTSMVEGEVPSLDDLKGPAGPVELPEQSTSRAWWLALGVLSVGGLGTAVGLWLLLRRRGSQPERVLSPQELAYLELQRILEQELSQRDVKLFYVELTGVVRRYIERSTGIHAPEQTTEEFLREIGSGAVFSDAERDRLASFLESADLVKFAAHQPAAGDIETTFERAKMFIGLTEQEKAV